MFIFVDLYLWSREISETVGKYGLSYETHKRNRRQDFERAGNLCEEVCAHLRKETTAIFGRWKRGPRPLNRPILPLTISYCYRIKS